MNQLIEDWWKELKGPNTKIDEVSKKDFQKFTLKAKIVSDAKELDSLYKDLLGDTSLASR